jgi:hypothetical protein
MEVPTADDSKEFAVVPPTRGGTPGIPYGALNKFVDEGGAPVGVAGGPIPETLIPGYVCRLLGI